MAAIIVRMKDGTTHYHGDLVSYERRIYTESLSVEGAKGRALYDLEEVEAVARIGCYHFGEFHDLGLEHGGKLMWLHGREPSGRGW